MKSCQYFYFPHGLPLEHPTPLGGLKVELLPMLESLIFLYKNSIFLLACLEKFFWAAGGGNNIFFEKSHMFLRFFFLGGARSPSKRGGEFILQEFFDFKEFFRIFFWRQMVGTM
jgi:hypothetical protein